MQRIILPGEVGSVIEPRLTVEGLRDMIQDLRRHSRRIPKIILVSEYERRDLNQDLLAGSSTEVAKQDQRPEHDGEAIGFVEGVMVRSHPDVPRGKARFIYPPEVRSVENKLGGEGVIIVGA
ncbi:MAG: hypothetical protein EPO20_14585 [Betaproteobacteria bacterium]|nr:MAG: hypothetical protein EPO20_14585 [Betaproteobacteria bacterium]